MLRTPALLNGTLYGFIDMRVVGCFLIIAISVIDCAADDGVRDKKVLEALSKDDIAAVASYFHYPPDQKRQKPNKIGEA